MRDYCAHTREDSATQSIIEQSVVEHLQGTAALCAEFAAAFDAESIGRVAGLLHDIGKYSQAFQRRIHDPEHTAKVDHSTAGAKELLRLGLPYAAFAVAGHHAGLPDGGDATDTPSAQPATFYSRMQKAIEPYEAWRQEITLPPVSLPHYLNTDKQDRIVDAFFTRMLYSCVVDADYLNTEAFMQPSGVQRGGYADIPTLLEKVRAKTARWLNAPPSTTLNEKRNAILRSCIEQGRNGAAGLYTLTVPTGGGKTIASLSFALEHAAALGYRRVIYVIPYTSIIDQTVQVFESILGKENVLAHHSGADYQLVEQGQLSPQDYRRALAAENWDAPVIVTTAVQFFESLYANRSSRCRKLHNLARSVIIFDEAQTLPLNYLRPCVSAITQLVQYYHTTAVLCTATQPALQPLLRDLAPNLPPPQEICPGGEELYRAFRRTTLQDIGTLSQAELCGKLTTHKQALCVVNRRKQAQALYDALPAEGRFCLTTLLCMKDRQAQLEEIRKRLHSNLPCRVVSTSLIEAGVDVDFPVVYRERAGLDSVLQAAGRCNREDKRPVDESIVTVFSLAEAPPPEMLEQNIAAFQAAQRLCPALDEPAGIYCYFDTLFYKIKSEQSFDKKNVLPAFAEGRGSNMFPFATVAEDFTLIESPTRPIYLPIGEGEALCARLRAGERSRSLYRALGVYSVSVYDNHFKALQNAGALEQPDEDTAILTDLTLYSRETGLCMDVETGKGWFI